MPYLLVVCAACDVSESPNNKAGCRLPTLLAGFLGYTCSQLLEARNSWDAASSPFCVSSEETTRFAALRRNFVSGDLYWKPVWTPQPSPARRIHHRSSTTCHNYPGNTIVIEKQHKQLILSQRSVNGVLYKNPTRPRPSPRDDTTQRQLDDGHIATPTATYSLTPREGTEPYRHSLANMDRQSPQATQTSGGSITSRIIAEAAAFEGLVEVRSAGSMGKGVFAMRDVARGTRIINEAPLFAVYDRPRQGEMTQEAFAQDVDVFCSTAIYLPPETLQQLDRLHYNADYDTASDKNRIQDWYLGQGTTDEQGRPLGGRKLRKTVMEMSRRYGIFKANCARIGIDDTGLDSGLFPLYARINHSCSPNAHGHYNTTTDRLTIHTTRDIEAGDQILINYIGNTCLPRDRRQEKTRLRGFECECELCATESPTDPVRQLMYQLDEGIRQYVTKTEYRAPTAPWSPEEAFRHVEELIRLLHDPSIDMRNTALSHAFVSPPLPPSFAPAQTPS